MTEKKGKILVGCLQNNDYFCTAFLKYKDNEK